MHQISEILYYRINFKKTYYNAWSNYHKTSDLNIKIMDLDHNVCQRAGINYRNVSIVKKKKPASTEGSDKLNA